MKRIRRAYVTRVHPESRTADVVFLDGSGGPRPRVPILGQTAGDAGSFAVPQVDSARTDYLTGEREMVAVVEQDELGMCVITGFEPPPKRQGNFADGRMIQRFPSDAYFTVDGDGNAEFYHPSGVFIRVGSGGHEDLTGKDVDGGWKIRRNTGSTPTVTIGGPNYTLTLGHDGAISIQSSGEIGITTSKLTVTGELEVSGDAKIGGISFLGHQHGLVQPGGGESGPPAAP